MTTYDSFLEDSFDRGFGGNERAYGKNAIDLEESDDFDDYFLTSDMDYDEADDDFDEDDDEDYDLSEIASSDTIGLYLKEMARVPLLDEVEEVSLAKRVEAGRKARKQLNKAQNMNVPMSGASSSKMARMPASISSRPILAWLFQLLKNT